MAVLPVFMEPEVRLERWHFLSDNGLYRLVGVRADVGGRRITSTVVEVDMAARRVVTESGRLYHLEGEPCPETGAELRLLSAHFGKIDIEESRLASVDEVVLEFAPRPAGSWH